MLRALYPALVFIMFPSLLSDQDKKLAANAERGCDLFLNADKGLAGSRKLSSPAAWSVQEC
jgi:hypothetical protein